MSAVEIISLVTSLTALAVALRPHPKFPSLSTGSLGGEIHNVRVAIGEVTAELRAIRGSLNYQSEKARQDSLFGRPK